MSAISIYIILLFPLAFIIHDGEEIATQHKWMQTHKETLVHRFPFAKPMVEHLSGLSTKAFTIAVLEELALILIATVCVVTGISFATEAWAIMFMACSIRKQFRRTESFTDISHAGVGVWEHYDACDEPWHIPSHYYPLSDVD